VKNYLAKQLYRSLLFPFLFVAICWLVFGLEHLNNWHLSYFGVLPRSSKGLMGIVTSVFIHGDLGHIASNSLPLLVLGGMLFFFYRRIAVPVALWLWLVSGLWLWIGGRSGGIHPTYHIGASTLIYALATFLFFSGVFRKHLQLMAVSAVVVFLYGSILWGIFPLKTEISWEGHLFGAIAGVLVAFNYREEGPQRKR
jgi:membrane associated rhomboid family serine protease